MKSIGFQDNTLEIEFKHGGVYSYFSVPERVHADLMASNSKGQFLNQHVKHTYAYTKH